MGERILQRELSEMVSFFFQRLIDKSYAYTHPWGPHAGYESDETKGDFTPNFLEFRLDLYIHILFVQYHRYLC